MAKWITNWPRGSGQGGKWGLCSAALAAEIVAEGKCAVRMVGNKQPVRRIILQTPRWAQTLAQRHPAVGVALRLSPLDHYRAQTAEQRRMAA